MKKRIALPLSATIAAAMTVSLGACTADDSVSDELMIYYSMSEELAEPLLAAFAEAHPEIEISSYRQPTEELMATLQLEYDADQTRADIILSAGAGPAAFAAENEGSLLELGEGVLEEIPENLRSQRSDIAFYGLTAYVLQFNANVVSAAEAPTSWADLADPKWAGRVVMADPRSSGGVHPFIWFVGENPTGDPDLGWDFFERLGENDVMLVSSHNNIAELGVSGERPVGPTVHASVGPLIAAGEPVSMVWAEEGSPSAAPEVGILSSTQNEKGARAFVAWLLSAEGQQRMYELTSIMPVNPAVEGAVFPDGTPVDEANLYLVESGDIAMDLVTPFYAALGR